MTTQYAYNGDGARVSKTADGATTQYVLDLAASLPVVISDTDAIYLYGLDIIAQQQAQRHYYVHDGLGTVRQLTDPTGQIATSYAYDPFGVPLSASTVPNPYRYTGEAWDNEVELLYLRARYYQPATGRFVTRDPWAGDSWRPGTLNGYAYVQNNAVNYIDPSGLDGWGPGGICPECAELAYLPHSEVQLPQQLGDLLLIQWVPHELLLGLNPDPYVTYQEMLLHSQTGYSRRASLSLAELTVLAWLFPLGPEHQWFGEERSFTQDVKNDPAIAWFKGEWARNQYRLPFRLPHERDPRGEAWLDQLIGWSLYAQENWELGMCVIGRGSETAEGRIDPVGGILGSLDRIEVKQAAIGMVRFEVHNRMDRASFSRLPGTGESVWDPVERRDWWKEPGNWWGTTVYQHFYWHEPHPLGPWAQKNY